MSVEIIVKGTGKVWEVFRGVDLKDVARQLRNSDYAEPSTIREYMQIVAKRIKRLYDKDIDTTQRALKFFEQLEELGFLEIRRL